MNTPGQAPDHIPYKITSQEKTQALQPTGQFIDVWRVGFLGPNSYHGYIEVPDHEYTPANVDALIENELDTIMGVHDLGEQPHPENLAQ